MLTSRLISPVFRNLAGRRSMSAIAGPNQVHVPKGEKLALAAVMAACWVAVPGWILVHIREYRGMA